MRSGPRHSGGSQRFKGNNAPLRGCNAKRPRGNSLKCSGNSLKGSNPRCSALSLKDNRSPTGAVAAGSMAAARNAGFPDSVAVVAEPRLASTAFDA